MNRTVICNIPMKLNVVPSVYKNVNRKLEVSEREVRYPVNALLEKNLTADDNVTALLLVKKANYGDSEKNTQLFIDELNSVNESIGAKIEYKIIETAFEQDRAVYVLLGSGRHIVFAEVTGHNSNVLPRDHKQGTLRCP